MAQRLHPRGRARPTERSRPRGSKRARRDAPSGAGCLRAWAEENDGLVSGWRASRSSGPGRAAQQAARRCRLAFDSLLRKIQGLPAALPSLSLELTVLYNSLLFAVSESDGLVEGEAERISHGLIRVLEACGVSGQDLSTEELWQKVLQDVTMEELCVPLHRLGALQGAVWLAANCLGSVTGLFRLLSDTKGLEPSAPQEENELLALLQSWSVPVEEDTSPLVVQSTKELKETLWTSAAFLQGLQGLEAGNLPAALSLLQAAATGFCSKRILAQIYTCIGCCSQRMGKPQTALQHLKRAVQVDSQCLSALSHAASLYHQLGETDAELEALTLLYKALETPTQEAVYIDPCMLIRTELLVHTPALASLFSRCHPSEVKYQLAQRCLQAGRCLHVLLRVQLVSAASIQSSEETPADALPEAKVLQKIRLLALLGRGSQFQELGRDKEALMNFQHGLQVCPGDPAATSHLLQVLWKLNRRQEAAALWQKLHAGAAPADSQQEAPGRPYPLYLASCLQHVNVPCDEAVVKNMQDYLRTSGQDQ
ncbi:Fanconi anemia group G protein isoform X5 [Carettochelys insculpta]|uniref:Fanconi anemia group G protein isoform X5 n=1 Tax=Carettochelys insculpta TaxID=44489 RepID=UPI003EB840BA